MRSRRFAILALAILFLLASSMALASTTVFQNNLGTPGYHDRFLASSSDPYSEKLAMYVTQSETFWGANLVGGTISIPSFSLPAGISSFSLSLTHYNSWNTQFETFTKYGLGLLGPSEPMPNASMLTVFTTDQASAVSLANSLSLKFAMVLAPYSSNSTSFTFLSPIHFVTAMNVYFWSLLPKSEGGFANMTTESTFESMDLEFYDLSSSGGTYSISYGGLSALSSTTFDLYTQLGVSSLNYSTASTDSNVFVHVLGGIVSNSNSSFVNDFSNFSASASAKYSGGAKNVVPDLNGTLDFSFPVILAYRQISTLTPKQGQNVSVTVTVADVSPSGSPSANNVSISDDWIKSFFPSDFKVTIGNTTDKYQNMTSGQTETLAYAFSVNSTSGSFSIPAIPISYQFTVANKSLTESTFLNTEIISVGNTTSTPELEAIEKVPSGVIDTTSAFTVNVSVVNRGNGEAFLLSSSSGKSIASLNPGSTWSYNITATAAAFTSVNASIFSTVTWLNLNSVSSSVQTNGVTAIYGFTNPGSPGTTISKTIVLWANNKEVNVTLQVSNAGTSTPITNLTIKDSIPSGMTFAKTYVNATVHNTNSLIYANVSSLAVGANMTFTYSLNITSPGQNYVFNPANASAPWNNETVVHFSQGYGLPLGVSATKKISPSFGFSGSAVSEQLGISNNGTLPIFEVALSNSSDAFLSLSGSSGSIIPILNTSQSKFSTLKGNLTGAPGIYNTSTAAASFIFAGANQTATTNTFRVSIFQDVTGTMSTNSSRIEENHNIQIVYYITNPSNVTVSNIHLALSLPPDLSLVSGSLVANVDSLGPNRSFTDSFVVDSNLPNQYNIAGGNLTFQYNGQTLTGTTTGLGMFIVDDLTTRYLIPILVGLVIVIGVVLYVRRITK